MLQQDAEEFAVYLTDGIKDLKKAFIEHAIDENINQNSQKNKNNNNDNISDIIDLKKNKKHAKTQSVDGTIVAGTTNTINAENMKKNEITMNSDGTQKIQRKESTKQELAEHTLKRLRVMKHVDPAFGGLFANTKTCTVCYNQWVTFDAFTDLSVLFFYLFVCVFFFLFFSFYFKTQ